jgi:hypothetical protein
MRKHLVALFLLALMAGTATVNAQCKAKELVKRWKGELAPFEYDAYAIDEFEFKAEKQTFSIEFVCMGGLTYKLIFCNSKTGVPIGLTIYDKPKSSSKRKVIQFDDSGKEGFLSSFVPPTTSTFYIEYEVPAASDKAPLGSKGCILMLIGVKEN